MHILKILAILGIAKVLGLSTAAAGGLNVLDHGVVGDGSTLNTEAIESVIALCGKTGAGTVRFPRGTYMTEPLKLPDFIEIVLEDGAELVLASDDEGDRLDEDRALLSIRNQRGIVIRGGELSVQDAGTAVQIENSRQVQVIGTRISGQRGIHAKGAQRLLLQDVHVDVAELPPFLIMDSDNVDLVGISSPSTSNEPIVSLHNCRNVLIRDSVAMQRNRTFVMVLGSGSENIELRDNDLSEASHPFLEGADVLPGIVKMDAK